MTAGLTRRSGPGSRRRGVLRRGDVGPLVLSVSVTVALARLVTHGLGASVLVPLVLAAVVADVVTALVARRTPMLAVPAAALAALAVLLVAVEPSVFDPASHHFLSGNYLSTRFDRARDALANDGTPLPHLAGVILGVGALGIVAATFSRALWVHRRRTGAPASGAPGALAPCLLPSFAVFIYTTLVSAQQGRLPAALVYFTGVACFVAVADRAHALPTAPRRPRRRSLVGIPTAGTAVVAAAVVAAVAGAGVGLSSMRLTVFHVTPPASGHGPASGSTVLTGLDLVDNLRTVELHATHTVVFTATSPVATYWQVGTLSDFDGSQWLPTSAELAALAGQSSVTAAQLAPVPLPSPSAASLPQIDVSVAIRDLSSRLLPTPPHPIAASGNVALTVLADQGILAATSSRAGTRYTARSWLSTTGSVEGPQLATGDPRLTPYLTVPADEPAVVSQLAHQAVAGVDTPAFEVQALVDWFRSGQFRYTLDPPPTAGSDPLVQFLTVTKAGYCQQFAGAFAVMARELGIPSRLAVGFLAGRPGPDDSFSVTGADAHVWPEVYLGPQGGWVSVEPTPDTGVGAASPLGVLEPSTGPQAAGQPTPISPPASVPGASTVPPATTVPVQTSVPSRAGGTRTKAPHAGGWPAAVVLAVLVAALGAWRVRRRRGAGRVDRRDLSTNQQIVRTWERVLAALARGGVRRQASETPREFAARLRAPGPPAPGTHAGPPPPGPVEALAELADMVEAACYDERISTAAQVERAHELATAALAGATR